MSDRLIFWIKVSISTLPTLTLLWMVWLAFNAPFEEDDDDES